MANKQLFFGERIGPHRIKTPEGYLLACRVPVSRTGWQQYKASELKLDNMNPETLINVYRDASDVFDPVAMASFEGKSITKKHPEQFLTADNDRDYAKGHAQNVQRGDVLSDGNQAMLVDLVIKDSELINYVEGDVMAEISCGYTYNLVPWNGKDDGELRLQMKDIRGNHIAIVPRARGGENLRVLDAAPEERNTMLKEELDAVGGFFKNLGLRLVTARDAESETVKTQEEKDKEANELKQRTMDAEAEAEEKKEKEEKKAQDAAILKALTDNNAMMKRLADGMEELAKKSEEPPASKKEGEDAKCTCDAKDDEPHKEACPMFKKAEDADLISVATLPKEDRPKNPIPGADADVNAAIAGLRALKPQFAASGNKKAIDGFNRAMTMLKGGGKAEDAYALIADAINVDKEGVRNTFRATDAVADQRAAGAAFEELTKKYHRKTVGEVGNA